MEYAAIIANWNGAGVIERCLGSALAAARRARSPVRVVALDDASTDGSADLIERLYPSVELIRFPRNLGGFGRAINAGVARVEADRVFLLNNDLALQVDFFDRLIEGWESRDDGALFSIGARTLEWESHAANHAGMRAVWRGGMVDREGFEAQTLEPADFVQMGACLVDRAKFLAMGGFSDLYHPGYWEDYDLSYQALRRGWRNYYEPRAVAYHWGKRSMRAALGDRGLALTMKRNHILFNWANLGDFGLLARHLAGLGVLALRRDDDPQTWAAGWGEAVMAALPRLPFALRERRRRLGTARVGDREALRVEGGRGLAQAAVSAAKLAEAESRNRAEALSREDEASPPQPECGGKRGVR